MKNLKIILYLRLLLCFFNGHKWIYTNTTLVKCNRTCKYCGKKMHSSYDINYGETTWLNGHYW